MLPSLADAASFSRTPSPPASVSNARIALSAGSTSSNGATAAAASASAATAAAALVLPSFTVALQPFTSSLSISAAAAVSSPLPPPAALPFHSDTGSDAPTDAQPSSSSHGISTLPVAVSSSTLPSASSSRSPQACQLSPRTAYHSEQLPQPQPRLQPQLSGPLQPPPLTGLPFFSSSNSPGGGGGGGGSPGLALGRVLSPPIDEYYTSNPISAAPLRAPPLYTYPAAAVTALSTVPATETASSSAAFCAGLGSASFTNGSVSSSAAFAPHPASLAATSVGPMSPSRRRHSLSNSSLSSLDSTGAANGSLPGADASADANANANATAQRRAAIAERMAHAFAFPQPLSRDPSLSSEPSSTASLPPPASASASASVSASASPSLSSSASSSSGAQASSSDASSVIDSAAVAPQAVAANINANDCNSMSVPSLLAPAVSLNPPISAAPVQFTSIPALVDAGLSTNTVATVTAPCAPSLTVSSSIALSSVASAATCTTAGTLSSHRVSDSPILSLAPSPLSLPCSSTSSSSSSASSASSSSSLTRPRFHAPPASPLPFWFGFEDAAHCRVIFGEYARAIGVRSERAFGSRMPLQFVGRVKRTPLHRSTVASASTPFSFTNASSSSSSLPSMSRNTHPASGNTTGSIPISGSGSDSVSSSGSSCSSGSIGVEGVCAVCGGACDAAVGCATNSAAIGGGGQMATLDLVWVFLRHTAPFGAGLKRVSKAYVHTTWEVADGTVRRARLVYDRAEIARLKTTAIQLLHPFYLFCLPIFGGAEDEFAFCATAHRRDVGFAGRDAACIADSFADLKRVYPSAWAAMPAPPVQPHAKVLLASQAVGSTTPMATGGLGIAATTAGAAGSGSGSGSGSAHVSPVSALTSTGGASASASTATATATAFSAFGLASGDGADVATDCDCHSDIARLSMPPHAPALVRHDTPNIESGAPSSPTAAMARSSLSVTAAAAAAATSTISATAHGSSPLAAVTSVAPSAAAADGASAPSLDIVSFAYLSDSSDDDDDDEDNDEVDEIDQAAIADFDDNDYDDDDEDDDDDDDSDSHGGAGSRLNDGFSLLRRRLRDQGLSAAQIEAEVRRVSSLTSLSASPTATGNGSSRMLVAAVVNASGIAVAGAPLHRAPPNTPVAASAATAKTLPSPSFSSSLSSSSSSLPSATVTIVSIVSMRHDAATPAAAAAVATAAAALHFTKESLRFVDDDDNGFEFASGDHDDDDEDYEDDDEDDEDYTDDDQDYSDDDDDDDDDEDDDDDDDEADDDNEAMLDADLLRKQNASSHLSQQQRESAGAQSRDRSTPSSSLPAVAFSTSKSAASASVVPVTMPSVTSGGSTSASTTADPAPSAAAAPFPRVDSWELTGFVMGALPPLASGDEAGGDEDQADDDDVDDTDDADEDESASDTDDDTVVRDSA